MYNKCLSFSIYENIILYYIVMNFTTSIVFFVFISIIIYSYHISIFNILTVNNWYLQEDIFTF